MSTINVTNLAGQTVGQVELSDDVLATAKGDQALHDAVVAMQANARQGNANTKGKGDVAGTGAKPWKQKGTGRARAGYKQSPVWVGGSVAHGPHPRDFSKKQIKKVARLALSRALAIRLSEGAITVVDQLDVPEAKTKSMVAVLKKLNADKSALIVLDKVGPEILRASRNLSKVEVCSAADVNVYQMLRYVRVVMNKAALPALETRLRGKAE